MAHRSKSFALFALSIALCACVCVRAAAAADVWATNATGAVKESFYSNETVYVASTSMSSGVRAVRVYITHDSNSWVTGTTLADVRASGYTTLSTNATGHIVATALWTTPTVGVYDIVVDNNTDGVFNFTIDLIDSAAATGFSVVATPKPTLSLAAGTKNPAARNWPLDNQSHDTMLHFNLTAGAAQGVVMRSLAVAASGTGNDLADISVVQFLEDVNNNGLYNSGETVLGYGAYTRDNGVISFEMADGYELAAGASRAFLIVYDMKAGALGSTYSVDVMAISADGTATLEAATVSGLPMKSAMKTLGELAASTTTTTVPATTTTAAAESTTTTLPGSDECQTDADCPIVSCSDLKKSSYVCKLSPVTGMRVCAATIEAVQCCGDGDCNEGEACAEYACAASDFGFVWLGGEIDYVLLAESVAVVVGSALAVFLFLKNRKQTQWKGKRDYEKDWRGLKSKWKK
jgi:hypothetical protein